MKRLFLVLLTLCSLCAFPPRCTAESPLPELADMVSFSYKQRHMERPENFSFTLEEKEGRCYLSAFFYDEDCCPHDVERREVQAGALLFLRELLEEQAVVSFLQQYRPAGPELFAPDRESVKLSLCLRDGRCLKADSAGTSGAALRHFFMTLALGE